MFGWAVRISAGVTTFLKPYLSHVNEGVLQRDSKYIVNIDATYL